jgi:hypothetical protein
MSTSSVAAVRRGVKTCGIDMNDYLNCPFTGDIAVPCGTRRGGIGDVHGDKEKFFEDVCD